MLDDQVLLLKCKSNTIHEKAVGEDPNDTILLFTEMFPTLELPENIGFYVSTTTWGSKSASVNVSEI